MIRITVPKNIYTMKHYRASPEHPPADILAECVTQWPSSVCDCRRYTITWLKAATR